jgi:energy-converting hydrogenase Eha subunit A
LAFSVSLGDREGMVNTLLVSLAGIAMAVIMGLLLTLPVAPLLNPRRFSRS